MKGILYVRELPEDEWVEYNKQRNIIEQFANITGMSALIMDKTQTMRKTNGNVFYSFQEAIDKYPDHRFVFLDANANIPLTGFNIARNEKDVIICIGSDIDGYGDLDLSDKEKYKIDLPSSGGRELHAIVVAGMISAFKYMKVGQ